MKIKAFYCRFDAPGIEGVETIIANNEEEAIEILLKRIRRKKSNTTIDNITEIDLDKVKINNLTAGDLIRLINDGK